jgi:iron complex outermembrane receptor protein
MKKSNYFLLLVIYSFFLQSFAWSAQTIESMDDLLDLSLDELRSVRVKSSSSVLKITPREEPSAVTIITRDMLNNSGARRLEEALEIFVPNFQISSHNVGQDKGGLRGMTTDRDNKILTLVNGKIMNHVMSIGGFTEKIFPMFDDIKQVEVVRGAGASVWGPGAIAGVINIITFEGSDVLGTKVTFKAGALEEFQSFELRNGQDLGQGESLLLYLGIAKYDGANTGHSPIISGQNINYENIKVMTGGEVNPNINNIPNYYAAFDDKPLIKANIRYRNKNFDSWIRFTTGGVKSAPRRGKEHDSNNWNNASEGSHRENGYAQLTWFNEYKPENDYLNNTTFSLSFDRTEFVKTQQNVDGSSRSNTNNAFGEEELFFKAVKTIETKHSYALGVDYSFNRLGLKSHFFTGERTSDEIDPEDDDSGNGWTTINYALFGEGLFRLTPDRSLFIGARLDEHRYTKLLFSPRIAYIQNISTIDTLKIMANISHRRSSESNLRQSENRNKPVENEQIKTAELMYTRILSTDLLFEGNIFYNEVELLSWNNSAPSQTEDAKGAIENIGTYTNAGGEFYLIYKKDSNYWSISQAYTKLLDFNMTEDGIGQDFSAYPYGKGKYVTAWSDWQTKFTYRKMLNDTISFDTSLRIFWKFQGAKDWGDYNREQASLASEPDDKLDYDKLSTQSGYDKMSGTSAYLNIGFSNKFSKSLLFRLDLHNVLGWFDEDLNKRNVLKRTADYRILSPAVSITVTNVF